MMKMKGTRNAITQEGHQMKMKRTQLFFMNAMIMTATSLLLSGAGVWFNLYVSAHLGAEGMGVYQLILSVYSFAVTLASAGIHLATTRLVAEETARGNSHTVRTAMNLCLLYSLLFGLGAGALLFFSAPVVGPLWLGRTEVIRPMRAMALTMPLLSMSCAMGGYFTAMRRVVKPAMAQISEQLLRILLTVTGISLFVPVNDLETGCFVLAAAGALAEIASFLFEGGLYLFDLRRFPGGGRSVGMASKLLRISLPVAFSSYIRSGLTTTKNLMVPMRLQVGGIAAGAALSMFGAVHGVALPVILFPAALLNSFSGLIVPEMAQSHTQGQNVNRIIRRMLALNLTVSMGVCGILFSFSTELGNAISQNPDVGIYIRLLAPVAPIMYLDTAVDCMLKGIDEQIAVMRFNVYDALISLVMVWVLLPIMGIKGYIIMVCVSEVFNFALSFHHLAKTTGFRPDVIELVANPLLCSAIAAVTMHTVYMAGLFPSGGPVFSAIMTVGSTGVIYGFLMWITGGLRI